MIIMNNLAMIFISWSVFSWWNVQPLVKRKKSKRDKCHKTESVFSNGRSLIYKDRESLLSQNLTRKKKVEIVTDYKFLKPCNMLQTPTLECAQLEIERFNLSIPQFVEIILMVKPSKDTSFGNSTRLEVLVWNQLLL